MAIGAVSSVGSSAYTSTTSNDDEYVKLKLKQLGLTSTGNPAADKLLIQQTEQAKKSESAQGAGGTKKAKSSSQQSSASSAQALPQEWQDLMAQLGITSTGDIDQDYQKALDEIKSKLANATTDSDKDKYRTLQGQIEKFVADQASNSASAASAMVGASALGEMNKASLKIS